MIIFSGITTCVTEPPLKTIMSQQLETIDHMKYDWKINSKTLEMGISNKRESFPEP